MQPASILPRLRCRRAGMGERKRNHVVLLKAPKDEVDPYVEALAARGFGAACLPVLDFVYIAAAELREALCHPEHYAGLIITSQHAVEAIRRVLADRSPLGSGVGAVLDQKMQQQLQGGDVVASWATMPTFVVGPATQKQARSIGLLATVGEGAGNASALVDVIVQHFSEPPTKPLLFPCGNLSEELLPTRLRGVGCAVEAQTVYMTSACTDFAARWDAMAAAAQITMPLGVVFFSPSGVKFTLDYLRHLHVTEEAQIIAIGPSTEKELESSGINVSRTAAKPNPAGVAEAVASACGCCTGSDR